MPSTYALIMAGGAGTRLWPLSRSDRPKPLLPLTSQDRSMFQIAVERLYPLFTPERILVIANSDLTPRLQAQAPDLPAENFIIEPEGRDTAPAVGLGAIHIRHHDPDAVMAVLTADHHIADTLTFRKVLKAASEAASQGEIVTLGITPTFPSTGFGYIERGALVRTIDDVQVYDLKRFAEKPDHDTAESFIASGRYSWNSGMFIWPVQRVMAEFRQHAPDLYERYERIASTIGKHDYSDALHSTWAGMRRVSVDYALMEHIDHDVRVIPVEMGWSDIGNFDALYAILSDRQGANVTFGPAPLLLDTCGTLVYSQRLIAMIGVEDLVIVDTGDVVLVCRRDKAQDVKQIVERLQENHQDTYL